MCKYCDKKEAEKLYGITINDLECNDDDQARLFIKYDDCSEDEQPHYHLRSETNHIDASVQINYCPFCGRKL